MKNYRQRNLNKSEMLANMQEMADLLNRPLSRRDQLSVSGGMAEKKYIEFVDKFVTSYALANYPELSGMAARQEKVYSEMGVETRRAAYNEAVLEVVE